MFKEEDYCSSILIVALKPDSSLLKTSFSYTNRPFSNASLIALQMEVSLNLYFNPVKSHQSNRFSSNDRFSIISYFYLLSFKNYLNLKFDLFISSACYSKNVSRW